MTITSRSLRSRVTALAAVVVLGVLLLSAATLVFVQHRLLVDNLRESLQTDIDRLSVELAAGTIPDRLELTGDEDVLAQIVLPDGRVVATSRNVTGSETLPPHGAAEHQTRSAPVRSGEPAYLVVSQRVGDYVIYAAAPLDDIDASVRILVFGLSVSIPVVAAVLAGLIWWLVGRTLRPVEAIRSEVADITGSNLHRRVPEPTSGDEIERLAKTMNAMLDRVETTVERQRRFVADASHELRSPLTRIRAQLDVDHLHPETADLAATHRSVREDTEELQQLVEDLLALATHDAKATSRANWELLDLDDIVLNEVRRAKASRADCPLASVDVTGVSAAQIRGCAADLGRVVRNLVDNAARHCRSGYAVTLGERAGRAVLTVTDDGEGVATELAERIFERFARSDDARSRAQGGTGLGLAIVRAIVEDHGGHVVLDVLRRGGARFVVDLPLAAG